MLALERRNLILEKLQEEKRVVVSELSLLYNVSEETIRRDLDKLERDGVATKSYGGAVINENTNIDMPFNVRKKRNVTGKQKIAEILETLIEDGEHITLDASTSAVFAAKAIKNKQYLTVITNSIEIMIELSDVSEWSIISTGGTLKEGYLALAGQKANQTFENYNVEKAIISCKGIDILKGITEGMEDLAQAKQMMLASAKEKILLADGSKFNNIAFSKICGIHEIDIIITDVKPEDNWLEFFAVSGVRCLYPEN